jgi:hypothetical protein
MAAGTCVCGHPSRLAVKNGEHLRMTARLLHQRALYPGHEVDLTGDTAIDQRRI